MAVNVISILDSEDIDADLQRAAEALDAGQLVVLPTETVYGIAGRIDRPETLKRLHAFRSGHENTPMTLHFADPQQAWDYVDPPSEIGNRLVNKLWPGPVGLVFDVTPKRQAEVAARLGLDPAQLYENNKIVLRSPDHPVFAEVMSRINAPIVLTRLPDYSSKLPDEPEKMQIDVDLILASGDTRFSKPSTLLHVHPDRYEIVRPGVFDERIIERLLRTVVLFVCSGNTCRSPMAEALARKTLAEMVGINEIQLESRGFSVLSAGVYAMPGSRATQQAVEAVADLGADLSRHRSQPLTPELLHMADVIYPMGKQHAKAIQAMSPAAVRKIRMLDQKSDIEDPIGSDVSVYRELAKKLEEMIRGRLKEDGIVD